MRRLLPIAMLALLPAAPVAAQAGGDFRLIQHWDRDPDGRTTSERDTLQLRRGAIRTRTVHTDFVLRFDYRLLGGHGGALLLRAGEDGGRTRAVRVELGDGTERGRLSGLERTLADVTHDPPASAAVKHGWIACEIRALADTIAVAIDGRAIATARIDRQRPGYIAFEAGRDGLDLRGIRIAPIGVDAGEFGAGAVSARTPGVILPELMTRTAPIFPMALRRAGVTGVALLDVVVQADGQPGAMRVVDAPHPDLALSALDCVRAWRFKPATKAGEPVPIVVKVEVAFNLKR